MGRGELLGQGRRVGFEYNRDNVFGMLWMCIANKKVQGLKIYNIPFKHHASEVNLFDRVQGGVQEFKQTWSLPC